METITFYSYKGGVGRTLAIANVATYLALLGQKVVALDFDLEAPGLHYKLLPSESTKRPELLGLVDYIHAATTEGRTSVDISDYLTRVPTSPRIPGEIWMLPAGAAPSPAYWEKLSRLEWHDFLYKDGARGSIFFLELKEAIRSTIKPDVLLIDSRTGITEIGGVATTLLADKIICLLLNNKENLEGARVVLQALKRAIRPPGLSPVQIYPVMSRLPIGTDPDTERTSVERARDFLNEGDGNDSGLSIDEILVLHTEPALFDAELILVGGDLTPDKSPLLRDYLRLFAKTINPDVIKRNFTPIIDRALAHLLSDPDEAQRELESLAFSFNLAPAFRELLKVYRLRNVGADAILRVAQRLWHFGDTADIALLYSVVRKHFRGLYRWDKKEYNLYFVEDVWRKEGSLDPAVAVALAESFDNFSDRSRALSVLEDAWKTSDKDDDLLATYIKQLTRMQRWEEARSLIDGYRERSLEFTPALIAWARLEASGPWKSAAKELLEPANMKRIEEADPLLALQLSSRGGDAAEWEIHALAALEKALAKPDGDVLFRFGQMFKQQAKWPIFVDLIRQRLGPGLADRVHEAIVEDRPYLMPESWPRGRRR